MVILTIGCFKPDLENEILNNIVPIEPYDRIIQLNYDYLSGASEYRFGMDVTIIDDDTGDKVWVSGLEYNSKEDSISKHGSASFHKHNLVNVW